MESLRPIYHILRDLVQREGLIFAKDKNGYQKEFEALQKEALSKLRMLREALPELLQINYPFTITRSDANKVMDLISASVKSKKCASLLPTGEVIQDKLLGLTIETPGLNRWQDKGGKPNFLINYNNKTKENAVKCMNRLLLNIMLSLPAKTVHLSFVDLDITGGAALFTRNLDKSLRNDLITNVRDLEELIDKAYERLSSIVQDYGDIVEYNKSSNNIAVPYEVVTLLEYPNRYNMDQDRLATLVEKGFKAGIYFVIMHNLDFDTNDPDHEQRSLLDNMEPYQVINPQDCHYTDNAFVAITPIADNKVLCKAAFDYLNTEATRVEQRVLRAGYADMVNKRNEGSDGNIVVPVGETAQGEVVDFCMSTVGHTHSFILGQSGSGKSVFLHNIILGAISKYSPEDLNLYLLDFKLGGVEFNRYKDEKHVKALLVDNSDIQITLEILRNINEQMRERGKFLRSAGVSDVASYNRLHPETKMPQILLVADECHVMFTSQGRKNVKQYNEISEIITKIAKEGRSQGVHLVLATQTLAQTEISSEILNNISDHYLLKCAPADSERMVRDSSDTTSALTVGQVFYHSMDDQKVFQAYFVKKEEGDSIVKAVNERNSNFANDQFYFVGSQIFTIDKKVEHTLAEAKGTYLSVSIGRSLDTKQEPVIIPLRNEPAENIMLFGIDDEEQVRRTSMSILRTMVISSSAKHLEEKIFVMNFLSGEEESLANSLLTKLERDGCIELVEHNSQGKVLRQLANDVKNGSAKPTVLFILGQERFRDLKFNHEFETETAPAPIENGDNGSLADAFSSFSFEPSNADENDGDSFKNYKEALIYILENGGEKGVHVVLQIDKPSKFLFEEYPSSKMVFERFRHLVMLHSDENAANMLRLSDDIALETLSADPDRLRAIYYNETSDTYRMVTPYNPFK
jgi:hypothetical protein